MRVSREASTSRACRRVSDHAKPRPSAGLGRVVAPPVFDHLFDQGLTTCLTSFDQCLTSFDQCLTSFDQCLTTCFHLQPRPSGVRPAGAAPEPGHVCSLASPGRSLDRSCFRPALGPLVRHHATPSDTTDRLGRQGRVPAGWPPGRRLIPAPHPAPHPAPSVSAARPSKPSPAPPSRPSR